MKVLVIYHSAVGNTKLVSNLMYNHLIKSKQCDIHSIESVPHDLAFDEYDAYVIGFPTFHSRPSADIMSFLNGIRPIREKKPAFIFTTCGWYSANALRIFAKMCFAKGISPVMSRSYRCIATDGVLIAPSLKFLFDFERKLPDKIRRNLFTYMDLLENQNFVGKVPRLKLYSVINYPNAFFGGKHTSKINLIKDKCTQCGLCVKNCNVLAYSWNTEGFPEVDRFKCVNCYRCIHHCPMTALTIHKKRSPSLLLDEKFYSAKEKALKKL